MEELPIEPVTAEGQIRIEPIGTVRSRVSDQQTGGFELVESVIELRAGFESWLEGLVDYSHLIVVYWLSEQTKAFSQTRPQGNPNVPMIGMFACR
ncbi:hypothetical protein [Fimbriimonas ginsengisoli]|uniref:TsaA-like domain-containing protein n=1 Tax=Fimbriimonas ginsengisoli Gsoil 348 TaxID=661478 RepID=A0A068NQ91_FIMGI|nr:hypothetical protein [Fimbriimonas ginsengisoli]AIE83784.1 hypothetical protein OP10G_0416 [Fimbriimonas ginsengisoli Gsoil 348]